MKTKVITNFQEIQDITGRLKGKIGFVPTMGFLHEGHLSLVKKAIENCDHSIVSIYVNPTQFAPSEDLDSYPRDFDRDLALLQELGTDYVFYPENNRMYPPGYNTWVEVKGISRILCGRSRPSHFKGVTTVVMKLVNLVNADFLFMGEKDYQQIAVLSKMLKDLNSPARIIPCPIIREKDGLAMSSRNKYLDEEQRKQAVSLFQSIILTQKAIRNGINNIEILHSRITKNITEAKGRIDYIEFRNAPDLTETNIITENTRLFLAVYFGSTRLIDNALLLS